MGILNLGMFSGIPLHLYVNFVAIFAIIFSLLNFGEMPIFYCLNSMIIYSDIYSLIHFVDERRNLIFIEHLLYSHMLLIDRDTF